jgi:glycosyltransferase involved in cell wall biosynthesis
MVEASRLRRNSERIRALRILHVAAPAPAGGLERVVEALAVGHHSRGHTVAVATVLFDDRPHPLVNALRAQDVEVLEISVSPRAYLSERRLLRDACRAFRPHVMHTHGYRTDVVDRGVAKKLGIATVTTVHGPSMNGGLKGALYERLQRANYRRFDAVVAVSAALYEKTLVDGVRKDHLHLIHNAWGGLRSAMTRADARRALGISEDADVIGWVGRLIPVKGGDLFLEALHNMPSPRPIAVMIGHGIELESLRGRAAELGLTDNVRFYPDITDAGRYFPAFDAYVLSSRSEGLPVVVLEAMSARVPIVAAAVGGVPEAVTNTDAWLVTPGDTQAMADAIGDCLRNREEAAQRVERAAQRLSTHFAFSPWLDKYEQVYRSVLSHHRKPVGAN